MLRRALVFLLCVLAAPAVLLARSDGPSGLSLVTVTGSVVDGSQAPVAGVHIFVTGQTGAAGPTAVTNERGEFSIAVAPGRYTVTAVADGFDPVSQELDVARAGTPAVHLALAVAVVREQVTVQGRPPDYAATAISSSTKTITPMRDVPQSVTVVTRQLIQDQLMLSVADVVRYVPGITAHQGENNRDQVVIRGNSSSADFFVDGVRDDVQYYRDLYNVERVEALKGPNAMIFGRGGGGGVINRVTKDAGFAPVDDFSFLGGSFGRKRMTADIGRPLGDDLAVRVNAMYEDSGSFRDNVTTERYGINPTMTFRTASRGRFTIGFEHFRDMRVADRGMPSYQGVPVAADVSTYFGDPRESHVNARADSFSASFEQRAGRLTFHDRTLIGDYNRGYQNFVPGAVNADETALSLSAYNNDTKRLNVFNQADVTGTLSTGAVRHTVVAGAELGRQLTDNLRNTGYFNNQVTSVLIPYADPTIDVPVTFRQSATDADNHLRTSVAAVYAQDQADVTRLVQLVGGVRLDSFDLQYHNNRTGDDLERNDRVVSPRAGIVIKPIVPLSLYGSYTISFLPSSGDQFSSLTSVTEQLEPERFTNYELGAKWDVRPALAFTAAAYRLDRTNTRATDPADPTRIVQTGSQRTNGFEAGINGHLAASWQIAGGYAWQDAFITSATTSAAFGARVAQVPRHTLSLWNMYQVRPSFALGAGIVHRSEMFAAIDDTVTLPASTDVDAAAYVSLTARARLQINVENLFNRRFFVNADGNNNISPGAPRSVNVALTTRF